MKIYKKVIILLLILFINNKILKGAVGAILDLNKDAKSSSLLYGDVANTTEIEGIRSNPATIMNINSLSGIISYENYLSILDLIYGEILYPMKKFNLPINLRFGYTGMSPIEDISTGEELKFKEIYIGAGSGYKLPYNILAGGNINFLNVHYALYSASSIFLNAGLSYSRELETISYNLLTFGVSLLNFGTSLKFLETNESLPTTLKAGFQIVHNYFYKIYGGIEKNFNYNFTFYSIGIEYSPFTLISLRASIGNNIEDNIIIKAGIGTSIKILKNLLTFDFTYIPMSVDKSMIFSLKFRTDFKEKNLKNKWNKMWDNES